MHPEDAAQRGAAIDTAWETRAPFEMEYRLRRADGEYRWMLDHGAPRYGAGGEFQGYAGVAVDITERKRSENELRWLTKAVEQSPASVMITDLHGKIEYVNPKFTSLTGYTLDEAVGQNPRILKIQVRIPGRGISASLGDGRNRSGAENFTIGRKMGEP